MSEYLPGALSLAAIVFLVYAVPVVIGEWDRNGRTFDGFDWFKHLRGPFFMALAVFILKLIFPHFLI